MSHWKARFFTIWTGQAFSLFGSSLVSFALIWWLTDETGSTATLATASLVTLLPMIVIGPFAGTLVDRWNRRAVLIAADVLAGAFHHPAMLASTSLMVPHEQLTRVGGMNQTLAGVLRIVAPRTSRVSLPQLRRRKSLPRRPDAARRQGAGVALPWATACNGTARIAVILPAAGHLGHAFQDVFVGVVPEGDGEQLDRRAAFLACRAHAGHHLFQRRVAALDDA